VSPPLLSSSPFCIVASQVRVVRVMIRQKPSSGSQGTLTAFRCDHDFPRCLIHNIRSHGEISVSPDAYSAALRCSCWIKEILLGNQQERRSRQLPVLRVFFEIVAPREVLQFVQRFSYIQAPVPARRHLTASGNIRDLLRGPVST